MGTKFSPLFRCITSKRLVLFSVALLAMAIMAGPAFAQGGNCLQNEYNLFNGAAANSTSQALALNCTANDVRVAQVANVRDLNGAPLTTCIEGSTFSFLADFEIVTSSTSSRSNIGLYFATQNQPDALTGSCVDNIISPPHNCPGSTATPPIQCGSDNYHELDPQVTTKGSPVPDNCGDTSSTDSSPVFGAAAEGVTIVVSNFLCQAPTGSTTLVLPNCTSWQIPGGTNVCLSNSPSFPYTDAATPGTKSKCNCGTIPLPITPVTPTVIVQKACTTGQTPGPGPGPVFGQNPNTQTPTQCNAGNGTTTESEIATYTVSIDNTTGTSAITVDQICDSAYGNVFTVAGFSGPACAIGTQCTSPNNVLGGYCGNSGTTCGALSIPATGTTTATCTFTAGPQPEKTIVGDTVTVKGHANVDTSKTFTGLSNSVSVTSTEVPSTATVTKGFVATEAGCATVRYQVDVKNTSTLDEVLTLSALSDSPFGDLTACTNTNCANISGANGSHQILGTNCGLATPGIGTFVANPGAGGGAFGTIAVGATYTCQFDGQFCSGLTNLCISNMDTTSATLKGDEAADVAFTVGGNTLTVQECFTATHSTTGP